MPEDLHIVVGEHRADIATIKEDLRELKENQKIMLDFITEQKAGRRYIWIVFGAVATMVAFAKDTVMAFSNLFTFKGFK